MTLTYLAGLTDLLKVIVQFVTFLCITKFDNMYSESILENKMLIAKDKKLKIYFYNRHIKIKEKFEKENKNLKFEEELQKLKEYQ